jgi:hypothetical protein
MIDYKLEHLCTYRATLAQPLEAIGPVPEGVRVNGYVASGEVEGPAIRGRFRPVGGDWLTLRTDGVGVVDVRATIETHDGALILLTYPGFLDLGHDGYANFLAGQLPEVVKIRTSPRFWTAHPAYAWLNRVHCLGIGEFHRDQSEAAYDVYAVR